MSSERLTSVMKSTDKKVQTLATPVVGSKFKKIVVVPNYVDNETQETLNITDLLYISNLAFDDPEWADGLYNWITTADYQTGTGTFTTGLLEDKLNDYGINKWYYVRVEDEDKDSMIRIESDIASEYSDTDFIDFIVYSFDSTGTLINVPTHVRRIAPKRVEILFDPQGRKGTFFFGKDSKNWVNNNRFDYGEKIVVPQEPESLINAFILSPVEIPDGQRRFIVNRNELPTGDEPEFTFAGMVDGDYLYEYIGINAFDAPLEHLDGSSSYYGGPNLKLYSTEKKFVYYVGYPSPQASANPDNIYEAQYLVTSNGNLYFPFLNRNGVINNYYDETDVYIASDNTITGTPMCSWHRGDRGYTKSFDTPFALPRGRFQDENPDTYEEYLVGLLVTDIAPADYNKVKVWKGPYSNGAGSEMMYTYISPTDKGFDATMGKRFVGMIPGTYRIILKNTADTPTFTCYTGSTLTTLTPQTITELRDKVYTITPTSTPFLLISNVDMQFVKAGTNTNTFDLPGASFIPNNADGAYVGTSFRYVDNIKATWLHRKTVFAYPFSNGTVINVSAKKMSDGTTYTYTLNANAYYTKMLCTDITNYGEYVVTVTSDEPIILYMGHWGDYGVAGDDYGGGVTAGHCLDVFRAAGELEMGTELIEIQGEGADTYQIFSKTDTSHFSITMTGYDDLYIGKMELTRSGMSAPGMVTIAINGTTVWTGGGTDIGGGTTYRYDVNKYFEVNPADTVTVSSYYGAATTKIWGYTNLNMPYLKKWEKVIDTADTTSTKTGYIGWRGAELDPNKAVLECHISFSANGTTWSTPLIKDRSDYIDAVDWPVASRYIRIRFYVHSKGLESNPVDLKAWLSGVKFSYNIH